MKANLISLFASIARHNNSKRGQEHESRNERRGIFARR